jgi:uncharacterized protein with NRDE domain
MSIVTIAWRAHPDFPLVLLFNRTEAGDRASAPAHWWSEPADVLAGRDLVGQGTWLAVSRSGGRFALVTGYREPALAPVGTPSRGELPLRYLACDEEPVAFARRFVRDKGAHAPFNLIVGNPRQAHYAATRARLPLALTEGVHTLANGLLDERRPQAERLGTVFGAWIKAAGGFTTLLDGYPRLGDAQARFGRELPVPHDDLQAADIARAAFAMLADRHVDDGPLPETGLDPVEERRRSAVFIAAGPVHTRSSTVFIMARDGSLHFEERCFDAAGDPGGSVLETWQQDPTVFGAPA